MARKSKQQLMSEAAEAGGANNAPTPSPLPFEEMARSQQEIDRSVKLVDPTPLRVSVVVPRPEIKVEPPAQYVVKAGGLVLCGSAVVRLPVGKIVDSREYDIAQLRSQKIELERLG